MSIVIHTLHVMLAGVWLGGVIFTTASVSRG
jgi:putative copper export protein